MTLRSLEAMDQERPASNDVDIIRVAARTHDSDRYLAALLGPQAHREDLIVLAALTGEIQRIGRAVRDPHLAQIRLEWWREALLSANGGRTGNPVADAFRTLAERQGLPHEWLERWFDALSENLSGEPARDWAHLAAKAGAVEEIPFRMAERICGLGEGDGTVPEAAASALGLARLAANLPYEFARGARPLPLDALSPDLGGAHGETQFELSALKARISAETRGYLATVSRAFPALVPAQKCAILPVALVEPYLRALEKPDHDLAHDIAQIAPLRRVWSLFRAHVTNRI